MNNNNQDDFTENLQKDFYNNTTNYFYWFALGFIIYTIIWIWAVRIKSFKSTNSNPTQVKNSLYLPEK